MIIIKYGKNTSSMVFGLVIVLCLAFLVSPPNLYRDSKQELVQQLLALDLGFSIVRSPEDFIENFGKDFTKIVHGKLLGFNNRPSMDRLDIDIKFDDMQTILNDRIVARQNAILINPTKVSAKIRYQGESIKAKVRLKGDLEDHWQTKTRMSLRVTLKGNKAIFGFKSFSIHKPGARQHPYDAIYQSLRKKSNGLSSNHTYAHIFVNGEDWGIMDIEEHMSKELLEKSKFKDSLIVRFGNEKGWAYARMTPKKSQLSEHRMFDKFLNTKLYGADKYLELDINRKWFSYISNKRLAEDSTDLYNVNKFSQALMMTEIWNNRHTLSHSNTRYYFNPYILKVAPITTDQGHFIAWSEGRGGSKFDPMQYKLYREVAATADYQSNFHNNLEVASSPFKSIAADITKYHNVFPLDRKPSLSVISDNLDQVLHDPTHYLPYDYQIQRKKLNGPIIKQVSDTQVSHIDDHIHARHYMNGRIEIFNLLPTTVKILALKRKGETVSLVNKEIKPYFQGDYTPGVILNTSFVGIQDKKISIQTEVKGYKRSFKIPYTLYPDNLYNPLLNQNPETFSFLKKVDSISWRVMPGTWQVEEPMKIIGNLTVPAGVELIFDTNAYLIVKGSINVLGTEKERVTFKAKNKDWKGIYIYEAKSESQINNTTISNTRALEDGLLKLTGGVTFYNSDVALSNVYFNTTVAEDALNIVHSNFKLKQATISSTTSDGFDSDFSNGTVEDSLFNNIGGDALDFSGSKVSIINTDIKNVIDKAVSVGEASNVKVKGGTINNVGVALASKDGSEAVATNVEIGIYTLNTAMTYVKKQFYGPSSLRLVNCKIKDKGAYSRQQGTTLIVDRQLIDEQKINVKSLYNSGVMKK